MTLSFISLSFSTVGLLSMNATSRISSVSSYIFMLYDSIILYFRVIYSNLFKNDVEVLEGAGVLVKSFPAGGFHDFNRIAFAKTHDPHTGPVTLDRIFTAFKNPFD